MLGYCGEFIEEALKLTDEIGLKRATIPLGLPYHKLAE